MAAPDISAGRLATIFLPLAAGYTLSYLYRNINAVMAPVLIADFGLTSSALGTLTAVYLLAFGIMQIPLGLLIDRFGARRVQAANLVVAASGAFVVAAAGGFWPLMLGRALIGAGVAVSLMGALAVFARTLPPHRVSAAFGYLLTFGGVGAVLAGTPTDLAVQALGWRVSFALLGAATLLTAFAVWRLIPDLPGQPETWPELVSGLRRIFSSALFWRLVPLAMLTCGTGFALHGLWAGMWLGDVAGLGRESVALHLSAMAIGLLVGSAACGPLAAFAEARGLSLAVVVLILSAIFLFALGLLAAGTVGLALPLWITIGFLINPVSLSYPVVAQSFPPAMTGRVNAAVNVLVLAASFAIQSGLGVLLDVWSGGTGAREPAAYAAALGILATVGAISLLWAVPTIRRTGKNSGA